MTMFPERVVERVLARWEQDGDCWISTYSTGGHGYAQVGWGEGGRDFVTVAHRVSWWAASRQPIPPGLVVDHICHVRRCINPAHLRLLPLAENSALQRGELKRTNPDAGLLCSQGHPKARNPRGHTYCRECHNIRARAARAERRSINAREN